MYRGFVWVDVFLTVFGGNHFRLCVGRFLAVFADRAKLAAVGAPLAPGFLIFSPEPAAIRFLLAWMLWYNPCLDPLCISFSSQVSS